MGVDAKLTKRSRQTNCRKLAARTIQWEANKRWTPSKLLQHPWMQANVEVAHAAAQTAAVAPEMTTAPAAAPAPATAPAATAAAMTASEQPAAPAAAPVDKPADAAVAEAETKLASASLNDTEPAAAT